jgi:hypothetical protein
MRGIAIVLGIVMGFGCTKAGENAGLEEAKKEADKERAEKEKGSTPPKKLIPPVPGMKHVACSRMINLEAFQKELGEKEPLSIKDQTRSDAEAAASCGIVRGGKRLTPAEQDAKLKKDGRLGVMPQDVLCDVTAYCWTIEDPVKFKEKCKLEARSKNQRDDDTMGTYACVQIVPTGKDDIQVFKFYDEDTKCILKVAGGPSQIDNDLIRKCAKVARDTIGPEQIVPGEAAPASGSASSGSGSAS